MAALNEDRNTSRQDGKILGPAVAASTKIYGGSLVARNASGYMAPAADTANFVVMGVSEEYVDNSAGANGDKTVRLRRKKGFWLANSGTNAVTVAHLGANVYVENDQTVASSGGTNNIVAGKCLAVDSAKGVLVEVG